MRTGTQQTASQATGSPSPAEATGEQVDPPVQPRWHRWEGLWRPAAIFLTSRLATLFAAVIAADLHPTFDLGDVLTKSWDSNWYLAAAEHGYPTAVPEVDGHAIQSTLGFFPLYPLAVRAGHGLGLSYPMAGLLVAGFAGLAATIALWHLARFVSGRQVADRAVALFCFFPGALVLSLAYSESLMLALSIGCLYALLRHRWLAAGLLAGFATATRPNAVALVVACSWAAGMAVWRRREWRALVAPALAPLGLVVFFAYLAVRTGDAGAYFRTQREAWGQTLDPASTFDILSNFLRRPLFDTNITIMLTGALFLIVTLALLVRARPPGVLLVYTVTVMGMALLTPTMGARPRFLLTAFPLVTVLAEGLSPSTFSGVLATSATLLGAFTVMTMTSLLATP